MPLVLPMAYVSVRHRHIPHKLSFFFTGIACCIGVRVISSLMTGPSPLQQPGSGIPAVYSFVPVLIMVFLLWGIEAIRVDTSAGSRRIATGDYVVYGIAVAACIVLWIASPLLLGTPQAFDSHYYQPTLLVIGIVLGLLKPGSLWRSVLAVIIGQTLGFLFVALQKMGDLWLMGLFFILADSFIVVAGAATGSLLRGKRMHPT